MLVFAISDKGGTGRSVTGCNLAYRSALRGSSVAYVDFDFGSPAAGAVFSIEDMARGVEESGVHSYLQHGFPEPLQVNVWDKSERESVRRRPDSSGDLVLMPGTSVAVSSPAPQRLSLVVPICSCAWKSALRSPSSTCRPDVPTRARWF